MADEMDIDAKAIPGNSCLETNGERVPRDGVAATAAQDEDVIEVPRPEQGRLSAATHADQINPGSGKPPLKKQKTTFTQQVSNMIGLYSSPRRSQRETGGQDAQALRVSLKSSEARVHALEQEKKTASREIEELYKWCDDAQGQINALITENKNLKQEFQAKKDDHRKETAQFRAQVDDLTRTKDRLRQMIVPVSETLVCDADVVSRFLGLRTSIIHLVRQTWQPVLKEGVDVRQLSRRQRDLYRSRLPLSYDRLRCVVFKTIHSVILGSQSYFLRDDLEQTEQHIRTLERDLEKTLAEDDRGQMMEWRNATFKATETLRGSGNRLSSMAADKIWNLLMPLIKMKSAASEQTGRAKLEAICNDAVELSLILRRLKDDFWVDNLTEASGEHISEWTDAAEDVESVVADTGHPTGTIAYVISGALVKSPKEDFKRVLVLEKAEVAVLE